MLAIAKSRAKEGADVNMRIFPGILMLNLKQRAPALIINPPTPFSLGVADPLQNIHLRAQTHIERLALGGFVIKAQTP
jgi:hypothetical protein